MMGVCWVRHADTSACSMATGVGVAPACALAVELGATEGVGLFEEFVDGWVPWDTVFTGVVWGAPSSTWVMKATIRMRITITATATVRKTLREGGEGGAPANPGGEI